MSNLTQQVVPEGYKLTEVGVIPEDWEVCNIGQFSPYVTSGSRGWADFYSDYGDLFVRITNMKRDSIRLNLQSNRYVSLPELSSEGKRTSLENGDLLISITADIGIISYVDEYLPRPAYINQHIALVRFQNESINSEFIGYYLASENVQRLFRGNTDQGAKAGINLGAIRDIKFALPVVGEQNAIVNAFSDIDSLIRSLEKLIAKKRAIKTATCQQLLTGKKRLPPFDKSHTGYKQTELGEIPEDWEVVELGSAAEFHDALRKPVKSGDRAKMRGVYRYYGASGVVDYVNDYLFDGAYILLGEDGENILTRNSPLAFKVEGKFWVNNHAHVMQPRSDFDIDYLAAFLENLDYSLLNSGTAQPKLNKLNCLKIKIAKPSKPEQALIAKVITDLDLEISSLGKKLSKTQQLKQGMMQELLTGKTRLIANPA